MPNRLRLPGGRGAPLLALVAITPLFPVVTVGPLADAFGARGNLLRAGFLAAMLAAAFLAYGPGIPRPGARLRPVVAGLMLLAGLGAVAAAANVTAAQGFVSLLIQLAGQPLIMAALLVYLAAYLGSDVDARDRLLMAFAVGIVAEAAVVVIELASGAAYDPIRRFTRAQGTVGANFIGALATMGLFIGFAAFFRETPRRHVRWIGAATIAAAIVILFGAVARSALIAIFLGGVYVLVADPRFRSRAVVIGVVVAALGAASVLTPAGELWTSRLDARSVQAFDRPATWVSGMRIALDDPWTGVGEDEIFRAVDDVRAYRDTPLGPTDTIPHNSWILAFAEGGIAALAMILALTVLIVRAVRPPPNGRNTEERFYLAALLGIGAIALVNNVFRHPELMVPVLMMVSILAARAASPRPQPDDRERGPGRSAYHRPGDESANA